MKYAFVIAALVFTAQSVTLQKSAQDLSTGNPIPICNGMNSGNCTEADVVVVNRLRRDHKRAAPGDADFEDQQKADAARAQ